MSHPSFRMKKKVEKKGPSLQVLLSPILIPMVETKGKIVVVIDVLRATSSMCVALKYGAKQILPVETIEEAQGYRIGPFLLAGERDAKKIEGFEFGNSPFDFMVDKVKGKTIVMTTTNGTMAINPCRNASTLLVGSFLNLSAICKNILSVNKDVILVCAGWKKHINMEDTLFAGAMVEKLSSKYPINDDAALAAFILWQNSKNNLSEVLKKSSHAKRFESENNFKDLEYCLQIDEMDIVPVMIGNYITKMKNKK